MGGPGGTGGPTLNAPSGVAERNVNEPGERVEPGEQRGQQMTGPGHLGIIPCDEECMKNRSPLDGTELFPIVAGVRVGVTAGSKVLAWLLAKFGASRLAATEASVADKLARYLLNPAHPVGGAKARWFERALGFTQANAGQLAKQIVFDASKAVQTGATEFGTKFNQVISITGANGRVIDVTFAWILNNDGIVRLVTAIPTKL